MNVANAITMGRLALAICLFALLTVADLAGARGTLWLITAMLLFITVVATDALDGYYARKLHQVSDFGRVADPAVDKIVVCGTLIYLASFDWARVVLPPWIVVLIVTREFTINGLRGFVESRGIRFGAGFAGKLKMIAQSVAIPGVFFFKIVGRLAPDVGWAADGSRVLALVLIWVALVLTLYSGVEYIAKAARLLKAAP